MTEMARIEALEQAVTQLTEQALAVAAVTAAQGLISRAVVEILSRGAGSCVGDLTDLALAMSAHIGGPVDAAVRVILAPAEAPRGLH